MNRDIEYTAGKIEATPEFLEKSLHRRKYWGNKNPA